MRIGREFDAIPRDHLDGTVGQFVYQQIKEWCFFQHKFGTTLEAARDGGKRIDRAARPTHRSTKLSDECRKPELRHNLAIRLAGGPP
jgi:hypothetical protein